MEAMPDLGGPVFYLPGPFEAINTRRVGTGPAIEEFVEVSPEADGAWTVRFRRAGNDAASVVGVRRLADGRPATEFLVDAQRNETAVFDPPLALVPRPGAALPATESADVRLYDGVWTPEEARAREPSERGTAERRFRGIEQASWSAEDDPRPAWTLHHDLVLVLSPARVRQRYESTAVPRLGIVDESLALRVSVFGVPVQRRREAVELTEIVVPRAEP